MTDQTTRFISRWLSIDPLLCLHGIARTNCWICKCQSSESRFLFIISVFKYLNKQIKWKYSLTWLLEKYDFAFSFLSQPSIETALQNINLKLTVKSIWNRKSNFQLSFLPHQLLFHSSNINHVAWVVDNFSTIE